MSSARDVQRLLGLPVPVSQRYWSPQVARSTSEGDMAERKPDQTAKPTQKVADTLLLVWHFLS